MTPTVDLTTERLELTPLTVADADAMVAVYSDELMYTYTGGSAPTLAALRERYQRLHGGWNHDRTERWCNWIVRVKGDSRAIGAMQATIAVDKQGNGYASEAARSVVEWLSSVGVANITATIHPDHLASAQVARALGMQPTDASEDGEVVWRLTRSAI